MNAAASVALAVLAAAGTTLIVTELRTPVEAPAPANDTTALRQEIADLRAQVQRLEHAPTTPVATGGDTAPARTVVPIISDEQIAAAIDRYFAEHGGALTNAGTRGGAGAPVDAAAAIEQLRSDASFWENGDLYRKLHEAGLMDELIDRFEQIAEGNPNDAQAQMDLANAYLAYLQLDNTKWQYSMKADEAFDRVLGLDENHWEARFSKAVSYTFWPDFLGKKKEAITHFERLIDQQDTMPVADYEAQTYLFLGNLLVDRDPDRAREIWQRGLRRHPGNAELTAKLGQ